MNETAWLFVTTGIGLVVTVAAILGLQRWAGVRAGWQPMVATIRAVVQLAALALVLHGVFTYAWTAALMLAVMMTVASLTAGKRLHELPYGRRAAAIGIVAAAGTTIALVFGVRMMELTVSNFIAVGGIITGNSMSAATLTGRRFLASSQAQRGEVEGWFALGAPSSTAFGRVSRTAIEEMLLPTIDQTKATGLVTMPGAFVGALIGGASPLEAARFQVVVLVSIMLAQTICGIIVTRVLSRATVIVSDEQPAAPTSDHKRDKATHAKGEAPRQADAANSGAEPEKSGAESDTSGASVEPDSGDSDPAGPAGSPTSDTPESPEPAEVEGDAEDDDRRRAEDALPRRKRNLGK